MNPPAPGIQRLNALPTPEAIAMLHPCCGSREWATRVAAARPFADEAALFAAAEQQWLSLGRDDWLEAFSHPPRIGERQLAKPAFAATAAQSTREQSGMAAATEAQRREFAEKNAEYEQKFGHIFLIFASGKSAAEMLDQLRHRISRDPQTELLAAVREQAHITRLRLERWLHI